jgi:hypothetical protein
MMCVLISDDFRKPANAIARYGAVDWMIWSLSVAAVGARSTRCGLIPGTRA